MLYTSVTCAARRWAALLLGLGMPGCVMGDTQAFSGENDIARVEVTRPADSAVLYSGCFVTSPGGTDPPPVRFRAAPSDVVKEHVVPLHVDKVSFNHNRPELRDLANTAYWCSDEDLAYATRADSSGARCFRAMDADPPATIEAIDLDNAHTAVSQGVTYLIADGYTLTLRVVHPGVLHVAVGTPCTTSGTGTSRAELEILP